MKLMLFALAFMSTSVMYAQNTRKEFEGIITYKTTIVLKDKDLDIDNLYKVFGRERQYYFKSGRFKWIPKNVKLEYEIFNPLLSNALIIDKYHSNDTLFYKDMSKIADTVTAVKKSKGSTILNISCNSAVFTIADKSGSKLFRTISYPVDSLAYAAPYFDNFKAMGQGFISRYTNSVPLKMELDGKDQPFSLVYEAITIEWKELSDSEFLVNDKLPAKR